MKGLLKGRYDETFAGEDAGHGYDMKIEHKWGHAT